MLFTYESIFYVHNVIMGSLSVSKIKYFDFHVKFTSHSLSSLFYFHCELKKTLHS